MPKFSSEADKAQSLAGTNERWAAAKNQTTTRRSLRVGTMIEIELSNAGKFADSAPP